MSRSMSLGDLPKSIFVATAPINSGDKVEQKSMKEIPLQEFEQQESKLHQQDLRWSIKVGIDPDISSQKLETTLSEFGDLTPTIQSQIAKEIRNNEQRLMLVEINNAAGKCLYSKDKIQKDTHICLYSDQVISSRKTNRSIDIYSFDLCQNSDLIYSGSSSLSFGRYLASLPKSNQSGNQASIQTHFVLEHDFIFSKSFKVETIAVENIRIRTYAPKNQAGVPTKLPLALKDIDPHQLIGFCYGKIYWLSQSIYPILLHTNGCPVDPLLYRVRKQFRCKFMTSNNQSLTRIFYWSDVINHLSRNEKLIFTVPSIYDSSTGPVPTKYDYTDNILKILKEKNLDFKLLAKFFVLEKKLIHTAYTPEEKAEREQYFKNIDQILKQLPTFITINPVVISSFNTPVDSKESTTDQKPTIFQEKNKPTSNPQSKDSTTTLPSVETSEKSNLEKNHNSYTYRQTCSL